MEMTQHTRMSVNVGTVQLVSIALGLDGIPQLDHVTQAITVHLVHQAHKKFHVTQGHTVWERTKNQNCVPLGHSSLTSPGRISMTALIVLLVFIVPHLVKLITLIHVKMVHIAQVALPYQTQLSAQLGFSAPLVVPYPNHVVQEHSPTLQGGTAVTLVLMASTASLWSLQEMNPSDTASVQGGTTVQRGLVLIGVHAQQVPTVIVLACTLRSNARTVMLESSVMEET